MNPSSTPNEASRRRRLWLWIGGVALSLCLAFVFGIASFFMLNRDARMLRDEMSGPRGSSSMRTKIQLSFGPLSTGFARMVVGHIDGVDEEARQALAAVRAVSFGLYELDSADLPQADHSELDRRMGKRGWQRMVTVRERRESVVIYGPAGEHSGSQLPLCIAVREGKNLIIVSVRADPRPLIELATRELRHHPLRL